MLSHTAKRIHLWRRKGIIHSVQQLQVTIASGAASGTATIPKSVDTTKTVLFFQNFTSAVNNTLYRDYASDVTLTDKSTLTATRNGTPVGAITVYVTVVEFKPWAIVGSVQYGSITIASAGTSNTATINSVDVNYSAVFYLGFTSNSASDNFASRNNVTLALTNSTTVTCTRGVNPSFTTTGRFCVVEFSRFVVKSVQSRSVTLTSANNADTDTISSVDINSSMILYNGSTQSATGINNIKEWAYWLTLTNSTTTTLTRAGTSTTSHVVRYTVLEFHKNIIRNIFRGSINMTSQTSNDATIKTISAYKGLINYTGFTLNAATALTSLQMPSVDLNTETIARAHMNTSSASSLDIGYEAVDFA